MYKIGEFSYLCKATVKTLRYYEKIGVLLPEIIDELTGYRYYSDVQLITYNNIKLLQNVGFTLKEIKLILESTEKDTLYNYVKKLIIDYQDKLQTLEELKIKIRGKEKIELIEKPNFVIVGEYKELNNRESFIDELEKIDKKVNNPKYSSQNAVFISYEIGYKESNITCFIGRLLDDTLKTDYKFINRVSNLGLEVLSETITYTMLHTTSNSEISEIYQSMIKYAKENNIQIRGGFTEIYNQDNKEIYVEAYNLNQENKAKEHFNKMLRDKFKQTEGVYNSKYVGRWLLQGQIIEPPKVFNPKKEHYIPDTRLKEIILCKDGTTNFDDIKWRDENLIIKNNFDNRIVQKNGKDGTKYLGILLNEENDNARPYLYYYKKIEEDNKLKEAE